MGVDAVGTPPQPVERFVWYGTKPTTLTHLVLDSGMHEERDGRVVRSYYCLVAIQL